MNSTENQVFRCSELLLADQRASMRDSFFLGGYWLVMCGTLYALFGDSSMNGWAIVVLILIYSPMAYCFVRVRSRRNATLRKLECPDCGQHALKNAWCPKGIPKRVVSLKCENCGGIHVTDCEYPLGGGMLVKRHGM